MGCVFLIKNLRCIKVKTTSLIKNKRRRTVHIFKTKPDGARTLSKNTFYAGIGLVISNVISGSIQSSKSKDIPALVFCPVAIFAMKNYVVKRFRRKQMIDSEKISMQQLQLRSNLNKLVLIF